MKAKVLKIGLTRKEKTDDKFIINITNVYFFIIFALQMIILCTKTFYNKSLPIKSR